MTAPALGIPSRIINQAMINAGLRQIGSQPNSDDLALYSNQLKDMINLWQTQGLKLWLEEDYSLQAPILVAGQELYTFGPGGDVNRVKPLRVKSGYYQDSSGNRRDLAPTLARTDYNSLSNVTQQGPVNQYYVDKQRDLLRVFLWLTPDTEAVTGQVHLILHNQVGNFTNLTETIDFPIEWYIALCWGLADEICTGQPKDIMDRCARKTKEYKTALEDWDVEDADTRIVPDMRYSLNNNMRR